MGVASFANIIDQPPIRGYARAMSSSLSTLTIAQLKQAAALKEQIELLEAELASTLSAAPAPVAVVAPLRKTKMSPAGRARIAAAQKARWAKLKAQSAIPPAVTKPKRTMSPAARRRISAGAKARWAKAKAAGQTTLKAA